MKNITGYFLLVMLLLIGCSKSKDLDKYTGTLEGKTIQIPTILPGKIDKMMITEGQEVGINDIISIIDTTMISLEKKLLLNSLPEVDENENKALLTLEQAVEDLAHINKKLKRSKSLYETNSLSKQKYDDVVNIQKKTETAMKLAESNLKSIRIKKEQLIAQIQIINQKILDAKILSPTNGTITKLYRDEGEAIASYMPVAEVMDISDLEIKIYVSAKKLTEIKIGEDVELFIDGTDRIFKGNISWISPTAEFTPKEILTPDNRSALVYAVVIKVNNEDKVLKNGMPAEVVL